MIIRGVDTIDGEAGFCRHCRRDMPAGPDACLGVLAGVEQACCGHGWAAEPYVIVVGGEDELRGRDALELFAARGVGPAAAGTIRKKLFSQHDDAIQAFAVIDDTTWRVTRVEWTNDTGRPARHRIGGVEVELAPPGGQFPLDVPADGLAVEAIA